MTTPIIITDEAGRQEALNDIAHLELDGKQWEVSVKRHRKRRSLKQNRLYFKWCGEVAEHVVEYTGYETDEIHEFFKQNFLPGRRIEIEGMEAVRFTTTKLNTKEMSEYCNRIYRWASTELGLALPLPPEIIEEGYDGPPQQANGAANDWDIVAGDLLNSIKAAPSIDSLEEITALNVRDLNAMEANAPVHYARVMEAVGSRSEYLNNPPDALHPLQAG